MAFAKGRSGNPGGRSKDKPWADALRVAVFKNDAEGRRRLLMIAEKCAQAAEGGDLMAMREIGDRLDGKPAQEQHHTVQRVTAKELPDDELAAIAVGGGEGDTSSPVDPSQLN